MIGSAGLSRKFNSLDGEGIKHAQALGIRIVFITAAAESDSIAIRASMLGVEGVLTSEREEKFEVCSRYLDLVGVDWSECWYAGDDAPDIMPMLASAMSFSPQNGTQLVKSVADVVSEKYGGQGFVREVCELASNMKSGGS